MIPGVVALAPSGQQRRTAVRPWICGAVVRELGTERHLPQHGFRLPTGVGDIVRSGTALMSQRHVGSKAATGRLPNYTVASQSGCYVVHAMEAALLQAAASQETLASREALQTQVDLITNMGPQPKGKLGGGAGRQNTFKTPNRSRDEDAAEPMRNLMRPLH
jgi:hypothetical protein